MKKSIDYGAALTLLFYVYTIICYIFNAIQFFSCDFASPYRDEIIHGIGLLTFYLSGITVWF